MPAHRKWAAAADEGATRIQVSTRLASAESSMAGGKLSTPASRGSSSLQVAIWSLAGKVISTEPGAASTSSALREGRNWYTACGGAVACTTGIA